MLRRAVFGCEPEPPLMVGLSLPALAVPVACGASVARHREGGVPLRASGVCATTDAMANRRGLLAGGLVACSGPRLPDRLIGALIAALVLAGARRILRLPADACADAPAAGAPPG